MELMPSAETTPYTEPTPVSPPAPEPTPAPARGPTHGGSRELLNLAAPLVARTKATTDLPVAVGLGVSNGDQAAEIASYADGVIVGSAFVRCLLEHDDRSAALKALTALTEDLAQGVRRA